MTHAKSTPAPAAKVGPYYSRGAQALRKTLERLGLSMYGCARKLGVSTAQVSVWASGSRRPSLRWALALEKTYGIRPQLWLENAN
jgi:plasmid maintenance system antidote protein VapI